MNTLIEEKYKVLFWDFDGVILNSNSVRDEGFEKVLRTYPQEQVEKLMHFHKKNGGLSRYVKFRFFFEEVRDESVSEEKINSLAKEFSEIMIQSLSNQSLLIGETNEYIGDNYDKQIMHIVSGSDQIELRYLCKELKIDHQFESIHGSPTPKSELVGKLIKKNRYSREDCVLIGDSINDKEAAADNGIDFIGYNYSESP